MSLPGAAGRGASVSRSEDSGLDQGFPSSYRLTSRRQFLKVYAEGRRVRSASFTVFGLSNDLQHCRLGVTVTRKVGGAVKRNRVKRVLRDVFRRHRSRFLPALDLVVNAHPSILQAPARELEREFLRGFDRLARGLS